MLIILVAGHDTTAYSLAWTLKELAKKPEEQSNLRAHLLVTPKEERNDLKALHNAIKERLRLHPVAAMGGIRTCTQDIVAENYTKDGKSLVIPKGSRIFLNTMLTLHTIPITLSIRTLLFRPVGKTPANRQYQLTYPSYRTSKLPWTKSRICRDAHRFVSPLCRI